MKRQYNFWFEEEINILKDNYLSMEYKDLVDLLPNHKIESIKTMIRKLKLRKPQKRKCDLSVLLELNNASCYWLGFLIADATFTHERRITLTISSKDLDHVDRLKKFLKSTNTGYKVSNSECYRFNFTQVEVVKELINRFNIHSNKTKNPCNLDWFNQYPDLFFSFIIGYLDGDGHVTKNKLYNNYQIGIVGDKNWLDNFIKMFNFIHGYLNILPTNQIPKINNVFTTLPQSKDIKKEYTLSNFYITNKYMIKAIYQRAVELNLPFMERKLGKLENFLN